MTRASPLLMLVDDDQDIREVLRLFLEIDGYRVTTATDGVDALEPVSYTHLTLPTIYSV